MARINSVGDGAFDLNQVLELENEVSGWGMADVFNKLSSHQQQQQAQQTMTRRKEFEEVRAMEALLHSHQADLDDLNFLWEEEKATLSAGEMAASKQVFLETLEFFKKKCEQEVAALKAKQSLDPAAQMQARLKEAKQLRERRQATQGMTC